MSDDVLYRIVAPHFVAGVIAIGQTIVEGAPIVRWMQGKSIIEIERYCQRKGWQMERVTR